MTPEEQDRDGARRLTGVYADRLFVQPMGGGMARLNFAEVLEDRSEYHTAVVASADNLRRFAEAIYNALGQPAAEEN